MKRIHYPSHASVPPPSADSAFRVTDQLSVESEKVQSVKDTRQAKMCSYTSWPRKVNKMKINHIKTPENLSTVCFRKESQMKISESYESDTFFQKILQEN